MNPKVDFYFEKAGKWQEEITLLRKVVLDCEPEETLKWGCPCYTVQDKNIVLIHVFKDYCALLFFKGALLADPEGILIQQTPQVQAPRQIRFTSLKEITKLKNALKAYIYDAIAVEESGLKVAKKKSTELLYPEEFQTKLDENQELKAAFEALTPGRQRAYNLFFSAAKQSKTRTSRVEQCMPQILMGKGLND
jgi:uncharacterized protein YdeI (YjbR/CyaY-like superfamily)